MNEWFTSGTDVMPDANEFIIGGVTYSLNDVTLVMWQTPSGEVAGHTDSDTVYDEFINSPMWQVAFNNGSVITLLSNQRDSETTESLLSIAFPD